MTPNAECQQQSSSDPNCHRDHVLRLLQYTSLLYAFACLTILIKLESSIRDRVVMPGHLRYEWLDPWVEIGKESERERRVREGMGGRGGRDGGSD